MFTSGAHLSPSLLILAVVLLVSGYVAGYGFRARLSHLRWREKRRKLREEGMLV